MGPLVGDGKGQIFIVIVLIYIFFFYFDITRKHQSSPLLSFCHLWTITMRNIERDGVSNHQPPCNCLLSRLFSHRSQKTSKLRVSDLCEGNSPVTGEFPAQRDSNAENVSIRWRHHATRAFPHKEPGGRLNKKDGLIRYGDSHVKDKTS